MPAPTRTPARLRPRPDGDVLRLVGVLDVRSVAQARRLLNALIDASEGEVTVDLEAVEAIDAAGLGLLVAAHRRTEQLGRRLVLRHPVPAVVRILAVTRFHRILHVERAAPGPADSAGPLRVTDGL